MLILGRRVLFLCLHATCQLSWPSPSRLGAAADRGCKQGGSRDTHNAHHWSYAIVAMLELFIDDPNKTFHKNFGEESFTK